MLKNSFCLLLLVIGLGFVNVSAQTGEARPISKGVVNGSAVSLPKPVYPPAARAVRASGAVNVQVLIDEIGNVVSAEAVSGHPLLRAASVQAAQAAKFKPTTLEGNPVKVSGVIVYNFIPPAIEKDSAGDEKAENSDESPNALSAGVLNGKALYLPKPVYPDEALAQRVGGAVNIAVVIDESGNVVSAKAVSGPALLREAAERAASEAKFSQTFVDGKTVRVRGVIVYNFVP